MFIHVYMSISILFYFLYFLHVVSICKNYEKKEVLILKFYVK